MTNIFDKLQQTNAESQRKYDMGEVCCYCCEDMPQPFAGQPIVCMGCQAGPSAASSWRLAWATCWAGGLARLGMFGEAIYLHIRPCRRGINRWGGRKYNENPTPRLSGG